MSKHPDRTYPREWYSVFGSDVVARTFVSETEHTLRYKDSVGRVRSCRKSTQFETWYPTLEEAEAVVTANKARKEARAADKRVRDAAPDLLAAAKNINLTFDSYGKERLPEYVRKEFAPLLAAIARAEGGAA